MSTVSPLLLKKGHVEFKTAYCSECGDEFEYPKHFKPRPTYCEAHDPNPAIDIDLSQFERAASSPQVAVQTVDNARLTNLGPDYELREVDGAYYQVHKDEPAWFTHASVHAAALLAGEPPQYHTSGFVQTVDALSPETGLGGGYVSDTHTVSDMMQTPSGIYYRTIEPRQYESTVRPIEVDGRTGRLIHTPEMPVGNKFADSRRMKSVEQIRSEYEARLVEMQMPSVCDITLPAPSRGKHVTIIHAGDVHIGTDACTYSAFREILDYVLRTPDTYIAFQGDLVDLLTAHSVGVMAEQALTIQDQFNIAMADLLPLAKANKILFIIKGNHEDRLDRATKNIVDGAQWMARILDVNYLYTEGYTRIHCAGASYLSYNLHGFNAGSSPGARRNKMNAMLAAFPSADVITCGHNHQLDVVPRVDDYILPDNTRAHKARYGIYTGTFHSYIGYPAEAGLGAGPLGCVAVHFDVEFGLVKPEILPVVAINGRYRHVLPAR